MRGINFASLCSLTGQYDKKGCRTGPPGWESILGLLNSVQIRAQGPRSFLPHPSLPLPPPPPHSSTPPFSALTAPSIYELCKWVLAAPHALALRAPVFYSLAGGNHGGSGIGETTEKRLFLQSSELKPPTPSPAGVCVPPLVPGRNSTMRNTLACGKGGGGSQFGRGNRHHSTLGKRFIVYVLCGRNQPSDTGFCGAPRKKLGLGC
jgi:hypothetical protein